MTADRRWTIASYAYGLLVAAVLGYFLLGLVVQVSDSFGNLLAVQRPTLAALVRDQFTQHAYLRPLLWGQIKLVYELSDGQYYVWFRGIHVVQVVMLIAVCLALMRPKTALDAALVPLGIAILTGSHTFAPMVREAFPINSFLTIAIGCLFAAWLTLRDRARWYTDALMLAIFIGCVLTFESGILVWVVCVAAVGLGARGLSRPAVAAMTMCLVAYMVVRMFVLHVGSPSLAERASGFGFGILEPNQLMARFEGRAWPFYLYNVVSSISTVLFSEPKGGVWLFIDELTRASVDRWTAVSVASSTVSTALIGWFVWTRRARFLSRTLDRDERIVALFLIALAANAVISFPYTKNIIMSPAGAFLAVATYVASRAWLQAAAPPRTAFAIAVVTMLSCGWAFREAGTHYNLRQTAAEQRTEWVAVDGWLERQRIALTSDDAHWLRDQLHRDAVWNHPTPFQFSRVWARWFEIDR
ncbi:MAG TPA: hypothetical protein VKB50_29015 [Vicinamibacterales bacterium]|nr:hypothetical protein [Vicinamibacterales bacterium]